MATPFDLNRLSRYISALVSREMKAITLAVTDKTGYLRRFVDESRANANEAKAYRDAAGIKATESSQSATLSGDKATEASSSATLSRQQYRDFLASYLGVAETDPTVSTLGDPVKDKAFRIRSTDGRLRYAVRNAQNELNWYDVTTNADPASVRSAVAGVVVFLDITDAQRVKGPISFDNVTSVPSVNDWTSTKPTRASDIDARIKTLLRQLLPPRTISVYFGNTAPAGWALCDGGSYPLADGSGNIITPDLRGRVIVGTSVSHAFGSTFGSETKTVNTSEDPAGISLSYSTASNYAGGGTQTAVAAGSNGAPPALIQGNHYHTVTMDVNQPSMALNYIMKL